MATKKNTTSATIETTPNATPVEPIETHVLTFGEKVQRANVYLETIRINCELAKKIEKINSYSAKDEITEDDKLKLERLKEEKAQLEKVRTEYISKCGVVNFDDATSDIFAFVCAWVINPQKGNVTKDSNGTHYDIAFKNMLPVVGKIRLYYAKWYDEKDSKEKTEARKELVELLNNFCNQYFPTEKSEVMLMPCENKTFTLTFAKFEKDLDKDGNVKLVSKEYANPKNCMSGGYKPMQAHFVNTESKPMIKNLIGTCATKLKWTKNGINNNKLDDYTIVQQVLLNALKYNLDFDTTKDVKKVVTVTHEI